MSPIVRIIANPISGRRDTASLQAALTQALSRRGLVAEIRTTEHRTHAAELAAVDPGQYRAVIVMGGDGTIRTALRGLAGSGVPVAICPTGTENLAAKYFGHRADAEWLAETVAGGRTRPVDLGMVNGSPFMDVVGFGFDAEVVRRLELARGGHISHMTYFLPIWRTFAGHRFPVMHVEADGERCCDEPAMVFVGNIPRYGLGLRLLRDAVCDDGLLDLCILPCRGRIRLLIHACRVALANHVRVPGVVYRQVRHVRVWTDEGVPFEIDGDDGGDVGPGPAALVPCRPMVCAAAVEFSVAAHAIRLLTPV